MWLRSDRLLAGFIAAASLIPSCLSATPIRHGADWEPEYVLVATAGNITINCKSRYSTILNGTSPGPTLHLQEGKTTWVRVWNRIPDDNVTVHWHGLTQRTAPFADGTPLVSQWPIAPNEFFDYEIHPEPGDAGTYFYHSHVGFHSVTAHGLLIVDEAKNATKPYDYDGDIPLFFSDDYPREDESIEEGLTANPFVWSGEPSAVVLNGQSGNASLSNATDDTCKPFIINVKPGKTYRLRFVGGTAISFLMAGIEGHDLTIIEADGHYTKPVDTSYVQFGSGQRYSALLRTKTEVELLMEGKRDFWMRYEARDRPTNPWGWAIVHYECIGLEPELPQDLPETQPVPLPTNVTEYTQWMEYTLEALTPDNNFPRLEEVTRTVYITMNQMVMDGFYNGSIVGGLDWVQNNLSWSEGDYEVGHAAPYLVQAYVTGQTPDYDAAIANGGWDPQTRAWPARIGEVLDIVWLSNSGPTRGFDNHPMHAHGEHYYDLGSGNGTYDAARNELKFRDYTPARRDTTMLYRYSSSSAEPYHTAGWRAWRIRVTKDNVGAWLLHCHVLGHMIMGMQTVWVFGDGDELATHIPQPYIEGYLEFGGSAYGNDTYDPLVMHWFD
ncbi:Cupredoxin [Stachybotrys elegans]|uniref:Cupredoxin n=1 Tax=Stachybotrys elegans TaxID=80388 RepID=A0A8K0WVX7_9HYPO|nr:Cupredoxin [Stachybotrys elegans]